jgi:hypothetical protein
MSASLLSGFTLLSRQRQVPNTAAFDTGDDRVFRNVKESVIRVDAVVLKSDASNNRVQVCDSEILEDSVTISVQHNTSTNEAQAWIPLPSASPTSEITFSTYQLEPDFPCYDLNFVCKPETRAEAVALSTQSNAASEIEYVAGLPSDFNWNDNEHHDEADQHNKNLVLWKIFLRYYAHINIAFLFIAHHPQWLRWIDLSLSLYLYAGRCVFHCGAVHSNATFHDSLLSSSSVFFTRLFRNSSHS